MQIGKTNVPLLVDTGSTIDIADSAVLERYADIVKLGKIEMPLRSDSIPPVQLPNGQLLKVIGELEFPAILANKHVHLSFYLIKDFAYSFLIGYYSLERMNAVISFGQKLFSINPSCNVLLKQRVTIPPQTARTTVAKIKCKGLPRGFTGFFTPKVQNHNKVSYTMDEMLVTIRDKYVPITIANYTAHPMFFFKNSLLGKFTCLSDNDIIFLKAIENSVSITVNTLSYKAHKHQTPEQLTGQPQPTVSKCHHDTSRHDSSINLHHINKHTGKLIPPVSHLLDLESSTLDAEGKQMARDLCDEFRDIFAPENTPINTDEPYFSYDLSLKDEK